jgi:hypothetical protein
MHALVIGVVVGAGDAGEQLHYGLADGPQRLGSMLV